MTITAHRRMALLAAFRPVTMISDSATASRAPGVPDEIRLHFDGWLDGHAVNVAVTVGGVWTAPLVRCAAYEAGGPASDAIATRVLAALGAESR